MITVSNEPVKKQDWEKFCKFIPQVKSFRFTSNPNFNKFEDCYRISYTAEVDDVNAISRFLTSLEDERGQEEIRRYKSLSIIGKIKYKLSKKKDSKVEDCDSSWAYSYGFKRFYDYYKNGGYKY